MPKRKTLQSTPTPKAAKRVKQEAPRSPFGSQGAPPTVVEGRGPMTRGASEDMALETAQVAVAKRSISQVVRLFLFKHARGETVKDRDVYALKLPEPWKHVIPKADEALRETFGFGIVDLKERMMECQSHGTAQAKRGSATKQSARAWALVNVISDEEHLKHLGEMDLASSELYGLIMTVYAFLYLRGGQIKQQDLLHLIESSRIQEVYRFGDAHDTLLKKLVKWQYLNRAKEMAQSVDDIPATVYEMGPRGLLLKDGEVESWIKAVVREDEFT